MPALDSMGYNALWRRRYCGWLRQNMLCFNTKMQLSYLQLKMQLSYLQLRWSPQYLFRTGLWFFSYSLVDFWDIWPYVWNINSPVIFNQRNWSNLSKWKKLSKMFFHYHWFHKLYPHLCYPAPLCLYFEVDHSRKKLLVLLNPKVVKNKRILYYQMMFFISFYFKKTILEILVEYFSSKKPGRTACKLNLVKYV